MKTHKNEVRKVLEPLFLLKLDRRLIGSVIHEFSKWVTNNGLIFAKARMKNIKVDYIRFMNNQLPISGIRRSHKDKNEFIPYGPFGKLFKLGQKHDAEILNLLNLYTRFPISPSIHDKEEAEQSITALEPQYTCHKILERANGLLQLRFTDTFRIGYKQPFLNMYHNSSAPDLPFDWRARAFIPNPKGYSEVYRGYNPQRLKQLSGLESEILVWKMNKRLIMRDVPNFNEFEILERGIAKMAIKGELIPDYISGEINFVQSNGKLRHVAAPYRFNQHLCRPLGDLLYNILRSLPWDCTFDQSKAIPWIQSCLDTGKKLWCFDLKKATDNIPLIYQYEMLKCIIHPTCYHHLDIWKYISMGRWSWKEFPGSYTKWTRGQPLGLYPSFASFAIFHGALLNAIRITNGGDFFIIGDDVVIEGDKLAREYEHTLDILGIPISENKTLRESCIAEFGGKIIKSDEVIDILSWDYSSDNIIDQGLRFGPSILPYLDKESQKLLKAFGDLPYPYGCNWFSSVPFSHKVYLCDELQKEHLVDGDSPEIQFRMKILNTITENMLDKTNLPLDLIIEDQDRRLGFAYSRLTRNSCEKLWADRRIACLSDKNKNHILFLQKKWLRSLYPILKTLDPSRNLD